MINYKKSFIFIFAILLLTILFLTCEKPDEEAPTVTILNLQENDVVYEIVTISCNATDNEAVEKVELWLDGEYSGISDDSEPYKLEWNTTEFANRTYVVTVRAYDVNGNKSDSNPINIRVDNTLGLPTPVNINSASYSIINGSGSFTIIWSQNNDDDFNSYTLYESSSENMSNQTEIFKTNVSTETNFVVNGVSRVYRYYQVTVEDNYGLQNTGNIREGVGYFRFVKTFGGMSADWANSVQQTNDGGYIVTGHTYSYSNGENDVWLIKTDSNGNEQWNQTFGGASYDHGSSVQQTIDGGYIIIGDTNSYGNGDSDVWIIKTDSNGNEQWTKTFGGGSYDGGFSVQQTTDGGYVIGGISDSGISTDKTEPNRGDHDYWVIHLDGTGNMVWQKTIGGSKGDYFTSIGQTMDGGYILGGFSRSGVSGDKIESNQGEEDYWVVKLDGTGQNIEWQNTIGGSHWDYLRSIQQTTDGGYILGGHSASGVSGDKIEASKGVDDYWVVKLNGTGNIIWQKTIGGSNWDRLYSIQQTTDGGYILGGYSDSRASGDKTGANKGSNDYWIVKLNGTGNIVWEKTIGGNSDDRLQSIQQATDGGYIITGVHSFNYGQGDVWLIKTDPNGNTVLENEWD